MCAVVVGTGQGPFAAIRTRIVDENEEMGNKIPHPPHRAILRIAHVDVNVNSLHRMSMTTYFLRWLTRSVPHPSHHESI
jgi:hypothetical protein